MGSPRSHLVIADTQAKPGIKLDHFKWIGRYIAEREPDTVIHVGDHFDLPSLCEYDRKARVKEFHSRSYQRDIEAGEEALAMLDRGLDDFKCRKVITLGNHDYRAERLILAEPRLAGALKMPQAILEQYGWIVYPYLEPVVIDQIAYCHQFVRSANGLVTSTKFGAPNARIQVQREMRSCTAGHKPGFDYHVQAAGRKTYHGLIVGSCYRHTEDYQTPQGNSYWRGLIVKHEVRDGTYNLMQVSLSYLKRKFG